MTKKIKDLNPFGCLDLGYHYEFFKGLVMNALKIEGIQNHSIEDFVKSKLGIVIYQPLRGCGL